MKKLAAALALFVLAGAAYWYFDPFMSDGGERDRRDANVDPASGDDVSTNRPTARLAGSGRARSRSSDTDVGHTSVDPPSINTKPVPPPSSASDNAQTAVWREKLSRVVSQSLTDYSDIRELKGLKRYEHAMVDRGGDPLFFLRDCVDEDHTEALKDYVTWAVERRRTTAAVSSEQADAYLALELEFSPALARLQQKANRLRSDIRDAVDTSSEETLRMKSRLNALDAKCDEIHRLIIANVNCIFHEGLNQ